MTVLSSCSWRCLGVCAIAHRRRADAAVCARTTLTPNKKNKKNRCPPCRQFTPRLVDTYAALKAAGHDVEVVFVSMDRDQAAFDVSVSRGSRAVCGCSARACVVGEG